MLSSLREFKKPAVWTMILIVGEVFIEVLIPFYTARLVNMIKAGVEMRQDASFIERSTGNTFPEGNFIDRTGKVLGRHRGIIHYTIGQRRGLGVSANARLYVSDIDPVQNTVTLAEEKDLYSHPRCPANPSGHRR